MASGYRVQFITGIGTVKDRVWTVPGAPGTELLLNQLTSMMTNLGPSCGFDVDWHIARKIAAHEKGTILDEAPTPPDDSPGTVY